MKLTYRGVQVLMIFISHKWLDKLL